MSRSDVVRRYHSAMTEHDLPAALETLDPEISFEPLLGVLYAEHVYHGHAGITRWYEEILAGWDAFAMAVRDTVELEDRVVAFLELAAHRGEETLDALIAVDCRFRGERLLSLVGRDAWAAAEELGLPAPPGQG
ncbi:MAG TPA: nuclear transport factor 2 family protein [Solirubrobacteraceae bacterium]|nr:nuclear transport factor 2 family protein [Solirubrobacteraceae bacterium]